jgi:hypothetical protein
VPNGRLGKKHTSATKLKISLSSKNRPPVSKETKKKLSIARRKREITLETRIKMSNSRKGKPFSDEHKLNLSISNKGKKRSEETKYKIRLATINDLKRKGIVFGCEGSNNFNPNACLFIDKLNIERGWNLQHAKNDGEIELYGYFVDGYDKERNIIFEYDEPRHNKTNKKQKDLIRQNNLLKEINPSHFLRYDEKSDLLYDVL